MIKKQLIGRLMNSYSGNFFLVLDGAGIKNIQKIVHTEDEKAESILLYQGTEYVAYSNVSPCIVKIDKGSWIFHRFQNEKEISDYGVVYGSTFSLAEIKEKMTNIVEAKLPSGNISLFRFYDPHVIDKLVQAKEYTILNSILCESDFIAWNPNILCYNDMKRTIATYEKIGTVL